MNYENSKLEIKEEVIFDMAEFYKMFCDPSRLKILYSLISKELTVSELVAQHELTQPAVSHQLRMLRQNGLVKYRRDGKNMYYSLDDAHVEHLLKQGMEHILHKNVYENQH